MLLDYHWHTKRCGHARGEMEEYVQAAISMGIEEMGFSDHVFMYWLPPGERDAELAMSREELDIYIEDVRNLQREYPHINIRLGLEVDYIPGWEKEIARILKSHPLDYVLGSVHYLEGWGFDNPDLVAEYDRRDIDATYGEYFQLVQQAARSGLFDIMAHVDLIKKFGHRPRSSMSRYYEETAVAFKEAGVAVEVNTAGLRAPAGEVYPCREFLSYCLKYNVPVTLGSDAHAPQQVGFGIKEALEMLKDMGLGKIAAFRARRMRQINL